MVTRRTAFEAGLVRVKALLRDRAAEAKAPRSCFISYAWGMPQHERWAHTLANDLRHADIDVLFDRWHNPPGSSISKFIGQIEASDFVVVVGTPLLREKYDSEETDPVVDAELRLINTRLRQPKSYGENVIPLLLDGSPETSFTPQLQDPVAIDFRSEELYFVKLFNLIWTLYGLPFDHPGLDELRDSMR